jgi:hypothetical protein
VTGPPAGYGPADAVFVMPMSTLSVSKLAATL